MSPFSGDHSHYETVVIGSGPAGQRAAIAAVKAGRRTLMIERQTVVGGTCTNTGTIPSKSFREAVMHLSGWRERSIYGASYAVKRRITMDDLTTRAAYVMKSERDVILAQAYRNGVDLLTGSAAFRDPHTLAIALREGGVRTVTAESIIVATGSEVAELAGSTVDNQQILTSDSILTLPEIPRSLLVVGGGVIGCEYASIFATLGTRVTLVDARPRILSFVDSEITDALSYHLRTQWVTLRLGEEVADCQVLPEGGVRTVLASGKVIVTEKALHSIGRQGATADLNLPAAGLSTDSRGRLRVNEFYQTEVAHIYAAGDVVGFPALASTAMQQGRLAATHAAQRRVNPMSDTMPYGIYTIPEIATCGRTEEELTAAGVPYASGKGYYRESARGQIMGDTIGMLKLLFHQETKQLLGVHILGENASELIHTGQAVLALGGTIDYFIDAVFNYPTLSETYKTAAHNGLNQLYSERSSDDEAIDLPDAAVTVPPAATSLDGPTPVPRIARRRASR